MVHVEWLLHVSLFVKRWTTRIRMGKQAFPHAPLWFLSTYVQIFEVLPSFPGFESFVGPFLAIVVVTKLKHCKITWWFDISIFHHCGRGMDEMCKDGEYNPLVWVKKALSSQQRGACVHLQWHLGWFWCLWEASRLACNRNLGKN